MGLGVGLVCVCVCSFLVLSRRSTAWSRHRLAVLYRKEPSGLVSGGTSQVGSQGSQLVSIAIAL